MKKTLSLLAVLMVAGIATTPAQAATHYVSGFGGISWMNNMDISDTYTYAPTNGHNYTTSTDLGSGLALTGAIGCDYGSYRLEAEVGYQTNDVKSAVDFDNGAVISYPLEGTRYAIRGDISVLSLMGNGYYDFDLGSKVELYATAGVGVAQVSFHNVNSVYLTADPEDIALVANNNPGFNGHETTLAWQVGAGISAPIADNVRLDLRYRYFATTDFTISDYGSANWNPPNPDGTNSANTNLSSHSVLLGLRVNF